MACTECATAFCEEHEPPRGVVLDNKGCTRWEKELQVHCPSRGSTYYCRCSEVCDRFYNTRRTVSVEAAIEEQNQQEQQQQQQEQQEQQQQHTQVLKKKMNSAVLVEDEDLPNRPVLPPSHSDLALVPGTVVDYDGYRWYVHWWWWRWWWWWWWWWWC